MFSHFLMTQNDKEHTHTQTNSERFAAFVDFFCGDKKAKPSLILTHTHSHSFIEYSLILNKAQDNRRESKLLWFSSLLECSREGLCVYLCVYVFVLAYKTLHVCMCVSV